MPSGYINLIKLILDDPEISDWFMNRMLYIKKTLVDLNQLKSDFEVILKLRN